MRFQKMLPTVLATSAMVASLPAQQPLVIRVGPGSPPAAVRGGRSFDVSATDEPRAVIGVTTTNGSTSRDTLGVLVSMVRTASPAEKAGIQEGDRVASINGVSLTLAAADVGDPEMAGLMSRRLGRELDKLHPGDDIDLRVVSNGVGRTVKVKSIAPVDLYATRGSRMGEDRATLGLNLAVNGSARDSLGVFVMGVEDGGPAAKAGIQEGSRIASINGVDLRSKPGVNDEDEFIVRAPNVSRVEREVARLNPGDDAELKVFYNGQERTVKVKAGRMSDLPRRAHSITIMGGDGFSAMPRVMPQVMRIDGQRLGDEIRRAMGSGMQGIGTRRSW